MQQRLMTARILWGALLASTVMFLVVLQFAKNPDPELIPLMPPLLGLVALGVAVVSVALPSYQVKTVLGKSDVAVTEEADPNASGIIPYRDAPKRRVFARPEQAEITAFMAYQPALILGCALSESVALFGFVLGFLGHSPAIYLPFFAVAWGLFAIRFPTRARVRAPLEKAKDAVFPA